jgi:hypothetical protein
MSPRRASNHVNATSSWSSGPGRLCRCDGSSGCVDWDFGKSWRRGMKGPLPPSVGCGGHTLLGGMGRGYSRERRCLRFSASERLTGAMSHRAGPMRLNVASRRLRKDRQLRQGGMGLARVVDDSCVTGCGTEGTQTSAGGPRRGAGEAAEDGRSGAGDAVQGGCGTWCGRGAGRGAGVDGAGRWPREGAPATLAVYAYARHRPPPGYP